MKYIEFNNDRASNLFQRLVVDKMRSVLRDFELSLLDMLAELPVWKERDVKTAYRHIGCLGIMAKHDTQDLRNHHVHCRRVKATRPSSC